MRRATVPRRPAPGRCSQALARLGKQIIATLVRQRQTLVSGAGRARDVTGPERAEAQEVQMMAEACLISGRTRQRDALFKERDGVSEAAEHHPAQCHACEPRGDDCRGIPGARKFQRFRIQQRLRAYVVGAVNRVEAEVFEDL